MITGTVVELQGRIILRVRDGRKKYRLVEAIVDTGFTGCISLPSMLIAGLGLTWITDGHGILADGTESWFDVYEATVLCHGRPRLASVISSETVPLVVMELLTGSEVNMKVRPGGAITIKPLRSRRA